MCQQKDEHRLILFGLRTDATRSPISSKTASDYLQEFCPLRQSLTALERRNFSLFQARRQIVYQRRLHLGYERFSLGRLGLYIEPQQRPHHLDCNFRVAMRLDRGHPWLPRKKQFYELLSERFLDIGCGIGRVRRVHEPDDGRVRLDGPYCHIEKLIHETTRRCLCTHGDQACPEAAVWSNAATRFSPRSWIGMRLGASSICDSILMSWLDNGS